MAQLKCAAIWTPGNISYVVLGLIFLKYISDAFQALMQTGHKLDKQDMVPDAREIMRTWYGTLIGHMGHELQHENGH